MSCLPRLSLQHWDPSGPWGVVHIERLKPLSQADIVTVGIWWDAYVIARRASSPKPPPMQWSAMMNALTASVPSGLRCGWDGKPENAMLRGIEVVFTDPLF